VLRVEPVYQTLRATRTEERCEPPPGPRFGGLQGALPNRPAPDPPPCPGPRPSCSPCR